MAKSKNSPSNSLDNVKSMLDERASIKRQQDELKARAAELDEILRPVLVNRGTVVHGSYQFEVKATAGRVTYDTKAAIADGIDLEPYKKVGAPSTRFEIKEVKVI